jgi:hypothetical protein
MAVLWDVATCSVLDNERLVGELTASITMITASFVLVAVRTTMLSDTVFEKREMKSLWPQEIVSGKITNEVRFALPTKYRYGGQTKEM